MDGLGTGGDRLPSLCGWSRKVDSLCPHGVNCCGAEQLSSCSMLIAGLRWAGSQGFLSQESERSHQSGGVRRLHRKHESFRQRGGNHVIRRCPVRVRTSTTLFIYLFIYLFGCASGTFHLHDKDVPLNCQHLGNGRQKEAVWFCNLQTVSIAGCHLLCLLFVCGVGLVCQWVNALLRWSTGIFHYNVESEGCIYKYFLWQLMVTMPLMIMAKRIIFGRRVTFCDKVHRAWTGFEPQSRGLKVMGANHSVKGKSHWPSGRGGGLIGGIVILTNTTYTTMVTFANGGTLFCKSTQLDKSCMTRFARSSRVKYIRPKMNPKWTLWAWTFTAAKTSGGKLTLDYHRGTCVAPPTSLYSHNGTCK